MTKNLFSDADLISDRCVTSRLHQRGVLISSPLPAAALALALSFVPLLRCLIALA
jgi:hypothetical protein